VWAAVTRTATREVRRWPGDRLEPDEVVREQPLEIRIEDHPLAVTMRTPGDDLDLAAGFLWTEGIVDGADDLLALAHLPGDREQNTVTARLAGGVEAHRDAIARATRELYATSACGICGKASLDRIRLLAPPVRRWEPDPDVLRRLPAALRAAQPTFTSTGGQHAAALFTADGELEVLREDVGRHNAVDKVLGNRLRADRVSMDGRILLVSGRAGFEIVQKARVAGVAVVAALGAASDLAIDLAKDGDQILVGFVREDRMTRYS
jgi:FdhD protein